MVNSERGQTLALFALVTPVMLALMALGLDAAQAFVEKRNAQGAADLASLAGARLLHDDVTADEQQDARDTALAVAVANGYLPAQVTVTTPYPTTADKDRILVEIDSDVKTFFMPILDLFLPGDYSTMDVDARAAAYGGYEESEGLGLAILALEGCPSDEKSVDISGSDGFFVGRVHSNSDIHISGSNMGVTGATTYACDQFHDGGGGNTFDPNPALGSPITDPFADMTYDHFCSVEAAPRFTGPSDWDLSSDGSWWFGGTKSSKKLLPGVYCTTGMVKLGDSDITIEDVDGENGITFVAQEKVELSGSNFILAPHTDNFLFVSYGDSDVAIKVSGSGGDWAGYIYAPNGTAEVSGQNNGQDRWELSGGVIGERVKLNGSDSTIDGTILGGGPGEQLYALVE